MGPGAEHPGVAAAKTSRPWRPHEPPQNRTCDGNGASQSYQASPQPHKNVDLFQPSRRATGAVNRARQQLAFLYNKLAEPPGPSPLEGPWNTISVPAGNTSTGPRGVDVLPALVVATGVAPPSAATAGQTLQGLTRRGTPQSPERTVTRRASVCSIARGRQHRDRAGRRARWRAADDLRRAPSGLERGFHRLPRLPRGSDVGSQRPVAQSQSFRLKMKYKLVHTIAIRMMAKG